MDTPLNWISDLPELDEPLAESETSDQLTIFDNDVVKGKNICLH